MPSEGSWLHVVGVPRSKPATTMRGAPITQFIIYGQHGRVRVATLHRNMVRRVKKITPSTCSRRNKVPWCIVTNTICRTSPRRVEGGAISSGVLIVADGGPLLIERLPLAMRTLARPSSSSLSGVPWCSWPSGCEAAAARFTGLACFCSLLCKLG